MKRALLVVGFVALFATLAIADTTQVLARFFGGVYVGPRGGAKSTNYVTKMAASPATYVNFAQLTDGGCETVALNFDTTTAAAPNPGDPCMVGVGPVLGVTSVNLLQQDIHSTYSCFVGVDAGGFLRRCQSVAQGAYDPDGGTFYLRAISSQ